MGRNASIQMSNSQVELAAGISASHSMEGEKT
jgi:hypothetical protein